MSNTASSLPEVIQEQGPVCPVAYWACSTGSPSMRKRACRVSLSCCDSSIKTHHALEETAFLGRPTPTELLGHVKTEEAVVELACDALGRHQVVE